jgi:hypothetical protein
VSTHSDSWWSRRSHTSPLRTSSPTVLPATTKSLPSEQQTTEPRSPHQLHSPSNKEPPNKSSPSPAATPKLGCFRIRSHLSRRCAHPAHPQTQHRKEPKPIEATNHSFINESSMTNAGRCVASSPSNAKGPGIPAGVFRLYVTYAHQNREYLL